MMKWLRRILDGRKTSKDENRQKAIHDLLTMSKADMDDREDKRIRSDNLKVLNMMNSITGRPQVEE